MAWTTPKTWAVNEVVTAANMNTHLRDNMAFVGSPPQCSVSNSGPQSVADSTTTALNADTEAYDNDTMHSTSSNTSRITATTAGTYLVSALVGFAPNATGRRALNLRKNGVTTIPGSPIISAVSGSSTGIVMTRTVVLAAGEYIEAMAFQSSGGALNVTLDEFAAVLVAV